MQLAKVQNDGVNVMAADGEPDEMIQLIAALKVNASSLGLSQKNGLALAVWLEGDENIIPTHMHRQSAGGLLQVLVECQGRVLIQDLVESEPLMNQLQVCQAPQMAKS